MKSTFTFVLALLCVTVGCSLFIPKEIRYPKVVQGQATSDEVQWQPGTPVGFWCDDYRLTLDASDVLRHWTHRSFSTVESYDQNLAMPGMNDTRSNQSIDLKS